MSILVWALLGLVTGFLASRIVKRRGTGIFLDLTLGVVGALVGGYLFTSLRGTPSYRLERLQRVSGDGWSRSILVRKSWHSPGIRRQADLGRTASLRKEGSNDVQ
jgi:uncharacterized membrane protein YeaQ/YmgE (transglycosylase-associated protein family)